MMQMMDVELKPTNLRFMYRNYRGEIAERRVVARRVRFGTSSYYPTPQMLLVADDIERNATREFAVAGMWNVYQE